MYDSHDKQQALIQSLQAASFAGRLGDVTVSGDCVHVTTTPDFLHEILSGLRDENAFLFKQLTDITADDHPGAEKRFRVLYHLLSYRHNLRLRIAVSLDDGETIPTACGHYHSAGWFEREVWDMFGIAFTGNPDLRRMLSDYGFQGHPLRKDFPLTGYVELRYDVEQKKIVYEDVVLDQEFRNFDFLRPWDGPEYKEEANDESSVK